MRSFSTSALLLVIALCAWPQASPAHQLKTAVLTLHELSPGQGTLQFSTPLKASGEAAALRFALPADCQRSSTHAARTERTARMQSETFACQQTLAGRALRFTDFAPPVADAVVLMTFAAGQQTAVTATASRPDVLLGAAEHSAARSALSYFPLGIEHILAGADHLMFLFCLLLLWRRDGARLPLLLGTVTAFTVAHSFTLTVVALDWWRPSIGVVEILIALSVLMLASEAWQTPSIPAATAPRWPIAFVFGLIHGAGFAGALLETGMPQAAVGWSLLLFNLGVEAGQLLFVAAFVLATRGLSRRTVALTGATRTALAAIGGVSAYWLMERTGAVFF